MPQRNLGLTLMELGKSIPQTYRSNRLLSLQEQERLRKQRLQDEALDRERTEFEQAQEDRERRLSDEEAARKSIEDYNRELAETEQFRQEFETEKARDIAKYGKTTFGPDIPVTLGTGTAGMSLGTISGDQTYTPPTKYELGQTTGLAQGAGVLPQTKSLWESIQKQDKGTTGGILSSYYQQRKRDAEEYIDVMYPNASPEEKTQKVFDIIRSPSGTYRHSETGIGGEEEYSRRKKLATLSPDIIGAEGSLAATKSSASQAAKAKGLKSPEPKDDQFIINTRSAYDDIAYAKQKFKPEFAKPYIGKLIKISTMKQLSTEFADFISSIEKGTATYRRENFGTAQTGTELENLKDVIDKDLAVKPEVLIAQIDKFLATAKRDYNDRIKYMKGQNRLIPEGYEEIGIKGGLSEKARNNDKWTDEKESRYQELLRKKQQGTLGQ